MASQGGNSVPHRAFRPPTQGYWIDATGASKWVSDWVRRFTPPTDPNNPVVYVLDLAGISPSVRILDDIMSKLVPIVDRRAPHSLAFVVATEDAAVRHFVQMLALERDLPLYVSDSASPLSVMGAIPVGQLSSTEQQTLSSIERLGGRVTAGQLAQELGIKPTAANNRLATLETKGLIYRQSQPGRSPDVFIDHRVASFEHGQSARNYQLGAWAPQLATDTAVSEAR